MTVPKRSRSDTDKLARRDAILDAAETAFREHRFDRTAMDAIARSAGLSRGLLYVYFKDKADIHLGLCVRAASRLHARMQRYAEHHQRGVDKVRAIGEAYVDFYQEEKFYFQVLAEGSALRNNLDPKQPTETQQAMLDCELAIMALMSNAIQTALDDGTIAAERVQDPLETAMFLRSTLHGAILIQDTNGSPIFDQGRLSRSRLLSYTLDTLTRALTLPSP